MKNFLKLFIVMLALTFLGNSCGETPFDVKDGGTLGANLYVTSAVKFFVGVDTDVNITYEKFENTGVTVSSIDYTVQLSSATLGESGLAQFSSPPSGATITVSITDLLAALPIGGNVLTEADLEPGDTFTFDFDITANGTVLNVPASTIVTVQCRPESGSYRVAMHDSYGDGWQTNDGSGGDGLQVTLDDGTVLEIGMCNPYVNSPFACAPGDFNNAEDFIVIPVGTESADWYFPGDQYGEISFEIYNPAGDLLFASGTPGATGAGAIAIINCE